MFHKDLVSVHALFTFLYLPGTSSLYSFKSDLFFKTLYKASFSIKFSNISTPGKSHPPLKSFLNIACILW